MNHQSPLLNNLGASTSQPRYNYLGSVNAVIPLLHKSFQKPLICLVSTDWVLDPVLMLGM